MSTSNVTSLAITNTGVTIPTTDDVLNGVMLDLNESFGGNLNTTTLATPQGYLGENITYYITQLNSTVAYLLSQLDPLTAEGRWQDAIGRLYYLTRKPATSTAVACQMIGQPNATITAGALATDGTYIYALTGDVTFTSGGTTTGSFENQTKGAIACPANTLNRISVAQSGWDAVNNSSAGVVGSEIETTQDFEYRRNMSVSVNARDSLFSIRSAVFSVADIIDVYAIENSTSSAVSVGVTNKSILANSIYVCVSGGLDADIANAIWSKKSVGCNMTGSTTVTVYDESAGFIPYPSYSIKFQRAASTPIYFTVNIGNHPLLPSDYVTQVKAAITKAFNGQDGGSRARIGADIYASRFYSGITAVSVNLRLISVYVGLTASPTTSEIQIGIDQIPTISDSQISVVLV